MSARQLADYFTGIGSRTEDVELALRLSGAAATARVVEIGCGDGRDAAEIVLRVSEYTGVDPSQGLLAIAREKLPEATFVQADALSYDYPVNLDVVFAFASLLHVSKEDLGTVFEKASEALRPGGIYYISLKERANYEAEVKSDQYGERMFYYYNPAIVSTMANEWFEPIHTARQRMGSTDWFTIALQRR